MAKRKAHYVWTDQWGSVHRAYGSRGQYVTELTKIGGWKSEFNDDRGLQSLTSILPGQTAASRYVRVDYKSKDEPWRKDTPIETPRLAGPKGPLP